MTLSVLNFVLLLYVTASVSASLGFILCAMLNANKRLR